MPRTKDEIWKQFNEVTLANGTIRAECKGCKASIVGLVSRMKTHFEACSKKRAAPQNTTDDEPTPKQTKQSTLPFLTSGTKQHETHLQIARCIIATGSAFRSVENKQFKNMVQLLRPGTVLPTRQLVSGTLRVCMDMLEVLDPVAPALDSMQKDSTTVSDSVVIWKHRLEKCPGSHKEFVVRRMNMAISPAV